MTHLEADAIAALWDDLLQRSSLPPQVAGVTAAEYELARLVQAGPVLIIDTPAAETWVFERDRVRCASRSVAASIDANSLEACDRVRPRRTSGLP